MSGCLELTVFGHLCIKMLLKPTTYLVGSDSSLLFSVGLLWCVWFSPYPKQLKKENTCETKIHKQRKQNKPKMKKKKQTMKRHWKTKKNIIIIFCHQKRLLGIHLLDPYLTYERLLRGDCISVTRTTLTKRSNSKAEHLFKFKNLNKLQYSKWTWFVDSKKTVRELKWTWNLLWFPKPCWWCSRWMANKSLHPDKTSV